MHKKLKLKIEMVPGPLFGVNLRAKDKLGKGRWTTFRRRLQRERGSKCSICGSENKPHGHEVWEYIDRPRVCIARLIRVEIICLSCHNINHWGLARWLHRTGQMQHSSFLGLRRHFRKINGCRQADFDRHVLLSDRLWRVRSDKRWRVDWGDFVPMIAEAEAYRRAWRHEQIKKMVRIDGVLQHPSPQPEARPAYGV